MKTSLARVPVYFFLSCKKGGGLKRALLQSVYQELPLVSHKWVISELECRCWKLCNWYVSHSCRFVINSFDLQGQGLGWSPITDNDAMLSDRSAFKLQHEINRFKCFSRCCKMLLLFMLLLDSFVVSVVVTVAVIVRFDYISDLYSPFPSPTSTQLPCSTYQPQMCSQHSAISGFTHI